MCHYDYRRMTFEETGMSVRCLRKHNRHFILFVPHASEIMSLEVSPNFPCSQSFCLGKLVWGSSTLCGYWLEE